MVKVGDILCRKPKIESMAGMPVEHKGPQPCVVIYVHPQGRYFVVEYTNKLTGEKFREAIYMQACEFDGRKRGY